MSVANAARASYSSTSDATDFKVRMDERRQLADRRNYPSPVNKPRQVQEDVIPQHFLDDKEPQCSVVRDLETFSDPNCAS
jgi:hypothetical protein